MDQQLTAVSLRPRMPPRRKTFEPVTLRIGNDAHRAHMLNLSAGGACLHTRGAVRVWQVVAFEVAGRTLDGRVSWVAGDRCGVRFVTPLTVEDLDDIAS